MSFATFPAALPYFEELHDSALLDKLISGLGQVNEKDSIIIADLDHLSIATETGKASKEASSHPFMEAFDDFANRTYTNNGGITHASTKDVLLDLYYGIELVKRSETHRLLEQAWAQDAMTTLHIIFYARSIHRGKSLKGPFFNAFCWLLLHHPRTALANLSILVEGTVRTEAQLQHEKKKKKKDKASSQEEWEMVNAGDDHEEEGQAYELLKHRDFKPHGYWKDLCTLLTIYCQDEVNGPKNDEYLALHWIHQSNHTLGHADRKKVRQQRKQRYERRKKMAPDAAARDIAKRTEAKLAQDKISQAEARRKKLDTRMQRNEKVCDLLTHDTVYRALHFTIARLFADQLKEDMTQLQKNKSRMEASVGFSKYALGYNLSLAAKWAPSLSLSHDKHTFLATSIAEILFPPKEHQGKEESRVHYLNRVRDRYRKQYLVPLREALDLTEHYMQEGKWEKVDIRHMPSVCLDKNMGLFFKHAPDVVTKYMQEVAQGKKKVSGATLGPHELVHQVQTGNASAQKQMVNGQWETLISSLRNTSLLQQQPENEEGKDSQMKKKKKAKRVDLGECIAVCDVSGSMFCNYSTKPENAPIYAAIGLSLVITNLAKPPFQGGIITFSAEPELFHVDTNKPFSEQVETVLQSNMGFNTDIGKVFTDVLLPMAKKHKLAPEDMVKRLFIFSDMEFDAVDNGMDRFMTTHEFIAKQFAEAGYEVPELVWWNLALAQVYSSAGGAVRMNAPVTKEDSGVALLSGFSSAMVKTFLDGEVDDDDDSMEEKDDESNHADKPKEKKKMTPKEFLLKAVYHESFNGLVVID
ncbi:hypothetical protein BDF20DRAFT_976701 [Mycotypha africana]|uniref:uncharacterized protein n=1 Tax=Mycotypha africana TaxID=64632 RepID=UPI0023015290|nr:uncharacterized protein BDF20DRAFT_976701 [Mycotypha africana]KAI8975333.1 hypothetical protein BDF20DRAFT_976701 [Mycotypha africana]